MKVLYTIHSVGDYANEPMTQAIIESKHDDIVALYHDFNDFAEEDRNNHFDQFTVHNEHGIFTSCPVVVESYVILERHVAPEDMEQTFSSELTITTL